MKISSSILWAATAILFLVVSLVAFIYAIRILAGIIGLLAIIFIALSIYARVKR
jgi:FtsH-binding integral membrane protein